MLLSRIYNINNCMMDDYTDQDWFEESVEINKNSAQQSPGNVPPDLADLGLVLDVPLDETFFFNGGEHHSTQSQQQYFNQSTQRSTIEQNHQGEGSTSMELGGKQLLDLDLTNQHQVYNTTQTTKNLEFVERKSQYLNCPPTTNLTALQSYLSEKPIQKHPPKSWSNNQPQNLSQQQQQQNYHQLNSANVSTMQFMTIPNDDPIYQNGGRDHFQSNNNTMVHEIELEPTVNLPSNCLNEQSNHSQEFYEDFLHHPGQQSESFCMQVEAGPSSNFMPSSEQISHSTHSITNYQNDHPSPQFASNNGSAKTVVPKKSKPKKKPSEANNLKNQHYSQPQQSNNQQQKNLVNDVNESSGLDKVFSNLFTNQQTATLKFNDPKLASEFAMLMARCSQLTEQQRMGIDVNAEIKETEANIATCIMRNTSTISPTNTFYANCANQNSTLNNHHQNNQNQQQNKPKRNRPKKKSPKISSIQSTSFTQLPPNTSMSGFCDSLPQMLPLQNTEDLIKSQHHPIAMMDPQILPPADGINLIMANEERIMPQPSGNDKRQQFLVPVASDTICQGNGWTVGNSTHDNFIQIPSTSTTLIPPISQQINSTSATFLQNPKNKLLNQTKQHHFIVHQQPQFFKAKQQKEQFVSVLMPTDIPPQNLTEFSNQKLIAAKQFTQTVYTKKQIRVVTKESAEELEKRLEKEKTRRRQCIADYFKEMDKQVQSQDYKTKFTGKNDCVKKLLPFGIYMEPEFSQDFMDRFDEQLQRHSKLMQERQKSVERRLQSLLLRETMGKINEEKNLLLFLDAQYEKEALNKEIMDRAPNFANYHSDLLEGISTINRMPEWEYNGDWDETPYLNITPFSSSPEPEIKNYDKDGEQHSLMEEEKIIHKELDVELLHHHQNVRDYATVKVLLNPYYEDMEKIFKTEQENEIGSDRTCLSTVQKYTLEQLEEKRNIYTKSPEIKLIPDNIPAENLSCVQQFSFENLVKEMIRPTPLSKTPTNSSIMPSLERDVALTEGIGMERIDTECIDLSRNIISHEKQLSKSNNNNESEKEKLEKSPTPIPAVKLTIKLGSGNKNEEILNKHAETAEEKKLRKEMKKIRKAEKKAKKLVEKEKKRKEFEEIAHPNEIASSSQNYSLLGIPPLKISLKKPSNLANGQMAVGPETSLSKSVGESSSASILTSGTLKLRISKQLPLERKENEVNNEDEKTSILILQNGKKEELKKERKNRKIEKKRKREAKIRNEFGEGNEEDPVEKKVPKIKIKFGGEMVATTTFGRQMERQEDRNQKIYNQIEEIKQPSPLQMNQLMTTNTNLPINSAPLSQSLAESILDKERKRIQFSPCSSDESDIDLRQRTTMLLSKIGRFQ